MRRCFTVAALSALLVGLVGGGVAGAAGHKRPTPHYKHVFIVILENEAAASSFGDETEIPYLAHRMTRHGAFVPNYYATGHLSLDNYISMTSGQGPNIVTQSDCQIFQDFLPGTSAADGQYLGQGCVYPAQVQSIANQLQDSGYTWHGYMEDMNANAAPGAESPCRHPGANSMDDTQSAEIGDQYAARHNPFVYYKSLTGTPSCVENDVDLTHLRPDLRHEKTTPTYSFITPNLCHDGHDEPCVNGEPGGMKSANRFLRRWVPRIKRSPAYKHRGLLIVTFDESESGGSAGDATACCNEQPGPNTPNPGALILGPGGGRIGAVMQSPCIRPGTTVMKPYNHYSMLRSIEQNFDLPYLGFAGQSGLKTFNGPVLKRRDCGEAINLRVRPQAVRAGQSRKVRFKSRARLLRCRRGVVVAVGGHKLRTNRHGVAKTRLHPKASARHIHIRASKKRCRTSNRSLKVRPPKR